MPVEIKTCSNFLSAQVAALPGLRAIVALGRVAHDATLKALTVKRHAFSHGAIHNLGGLRLFDSYHCSRYNTNTGVLTTRMFEDGFAAVKVFLDTSV